MTQSTAVSRLRTRKPTGAVPWPLILIDGEEKSGKSLAPAVLSADPRVGQTYWIDLGEGSADEYGSVPDARYEVVEHDGSYRDILAQVTAVWEEAERAANAGEPPVVLVIDSMSAMWDMLKNWTASRARRSQAGQRQLQKDPDAPVKPSMDLWNDSTDRWYKVVRLLQTMRGIVIVTARSKDVTALDDDGRPIKGADKVRSIEAQKNLGHDASVIIHMIREPRGAELTGVRSLRVQASNENPFALPARKVGSFDVLDLAAFVFDILGCNGQTEARDMVTLRGDDLEGVFEQINDADTEEALKAIWEDVKERLTPQERASVTEAITANLNRLRTEVDGPNVPSAQKSDAEKLRAAAKSEPSGNPEAAQEVA